jgi:hypothetical protein
MSLSERKRYCSAVERIALLLFRSGVILQHTRFAQISQAKQHIYTILTQLNLSVASQVYGIL